MSFPELNVAGTPANPHTGGLYSAAALVEHTDPARLTTGVAVDWVNSGPHGVFTGSSDTKGGARPDEDTFASIVVWAGDQAVMVGSSLQQARDRAAQLLRITESLDVETHLATVLAALAAPAPADGTGGPFVDVLGEIEHELGKTGVAGVIHASRRHAALAAHLGLVVAGPMGRLLTPLGNVWAFGGGYDPLGNTVVGTGPVTVHRGPVTQTEARDLETNERLVIAEREVVVAYEFTPVARTITAPTP